MVYGTLIAYIAQLLFQLPLLIKKGYKHKVSIASIIMYIIMRFTYKSIFTYGSSFVLESRKFIAVNCLVSVISGMTTYLILVLMLNIKEVKEIFYTILSKLKNILYIK